MNTTGGLLVLISLGLTILVGKSACNGLVSEVHEETNKKSASDQSTVWKEGYSGKQAKAEKEAQEAREAAARRQAYLDAQEARKKDKEAERKARVEVAKL